MHRLNKSYIKILWFSIIIKYLHAHIFKIIKYDCKKELDNKECIPTDQLINIGASQYLLMIN